MTNFDHLYSIIGSRIQVAREGKGITQEEMANRVGVSRTSISNIETGKQRSPLSLLYLICIVMEEEISNILPKNKQLELHDLQINFETVLDSDSFNNPHIINIIKKAQSELKQNIKRKE